MNLSKNISHACISTLLLTSLLLSGCGSDGDSENLAKAVKLEAQRQNGTIIESVTISGGQTRLTKGETHQLTASGIDSKGVTRDVTNELIWTSSDDAIAKVNDKGIVTAVENSDVNQGIITITGTTINDIATDSEISINASPATALILKQNTPEIGNINTCIDAKLTSDVTYDDGYTSLNTTRSVSFSLDENSTAVINNDGDLYTSAAVTEQSIVTGSISDTINNTLTIIAEPTNLNTLAILLDEEEVSLITLNIGERIQVNAQATLLPEVSEELFNIDNSVKWQTENTTLIGITESSITKGTLFALKPGVTSLSSNCGGKSVTTIVEVKGEATLDELVINEGEAEISLAPKESLKLTLTGNYSTSPSTLNVSEFAQWTINGSGSAIATAELVDIGTESASYEVTSTKSADGIIIVAVTYDGITKSVRINVEQTTN